MAEPNLQEIHDFLIELAKKAGEMIISANPSTIDTKKNCDFPPLDHQTSTNTQSASDLVTETDKAVEDMISSSLKSAYPTYSYPPSTPPPRFHPAANPAPHSFLGEESSPTASSSRLTPSPTFIVDPIDGTTNFVHAHPYISISLAFAYNLRSLVGIVYNPFSQHLYSAIRGQGSFLTRPSIATTHPDPQDSHTVVVDSKYTKTKLPLRSPAPPLRGLQNALVAVEWGNERSGPNFECKTATFTALAGDASTGGAMVHSLRSLGSAALNMCAVAAGNIDVYWEGGCWAWDVAAGWVIVGEAGGRVVGANKGEWEIPVDGRRYMAVRGGEGGRAMVEEFWGAVKGRLEYEV